MTGNQDAHPAGRLVEQVTRIAALCGGIVLLLAGLIITISVLLRWLVGSGIDGDFEMMEMAAALAVFAFLPFCQARRGNIMVDTFTGWMSPGGRRLLDALWDLAWAGFAALIAWQAFKGGLEEIGYGTTSMSAGIPVGPVIVATALLAGLLAVVALVTSIRLATGRS
ncbi:TRAP transporter small permease [Geminicoccus flavidas]|uniref:TRAP transporter small permease n=1 Tax=Geminicoccus flavidas TaxID=2506407 RepID=UPI00135875C0|nr:TRAP transporter small permease [Geminicoccus flavidas]